MRILIASLDNADVISESVRISLQSEAVNASFTVSSYGQIFLSDKYIGEPPDFLIFWLSGMGATQGNIHPVSVNVDSVLSIVRPYLDAGVKVILIPPELSPRELDTFSIFASSRALFIDELKSKCDARVIWIDLSVFLSQMPMTEWAAPQYWEYAKYPFHPRVISLLGAKIAQVIARLVKPLVKGIIVDLDDTLWGGTVGDVGPAGVNLDIEAGGRPYLEMQSWLLDLKGRGMLLGVASKNEPRTARKVFESRPEMLLSLEDLVFFRASWEPKTYAIKDFAKRINVSVSDVCFIDDSAFERDQARSAIPSLRVPELPSRASERVAFLNQTGLFLLPMKTNEDISRGAIMPISDAFEHDHDWVAQHLKELEMKIDVISIDETNFDRAFSLLQRTNQFNLTQYRPSPRQFSLDLEKTDLVLGIRYQDKLAPASIMAVVILSCEENNLVIENWVMSCRAFGRGLEWATAEVLQKLLIARNLDAAIVHFVSTERNEPAKEVLHTLNFREYGSNHETSPKSTSTTLSSALRGIPAHEIKVFFDSTLFQQ